MFISSESCSPFLDQDVTLKPLVNSPSRTELVYRRIRDCSLEPGKHLVQEELAAMLGVSRQPIQQAMLLLKTDGLIVESGTRGLYVAPLDPVQIGHHYQIRLVFDQLAAGLVAERAADSSAFAEDLRRRGSKILREGEPGCALSYLPLRDVRKPSDRPGSRYALEFSPPGHGRGPAACGTWADCLVATS